MKPLPCPFCGTRPKIRQAQFYAGKCWVVEYRSLRCGTNPRTTPCDNRGVDRGKHGAVVEWNSRPALTRTDEKQTTLSCTKPGK